MALPHLKAATAEPLRGEESAQGLTPAKLSRPTTLQRYVNGKFQFHGDSIAVESDLRLIIGGQQEAILSRTPGDDLNLVAGHLFSCSRIREAGDLANISFNYRGVARVDVELAGCSGIRRIYPSPRPIRVAPEMLLEFKERFERRQNLYKNTGSTHAAALFAEDGELISFGEDVGRHNAFDKAVGRALLEGSLDRVVIAILSSRLALELTVKAAVANIPILCGFSAATSSGISYAEQNNITLVGRLKSSSFNVYAHGWRLQSG